LNVSIDEQAIAMIISFADGDARVALNTLETAANTAKVQNGRLHIDAELLEKLLQRKVLLYDKSGEQHYNMISALHKAIRGSDPDAAIYWTARML